MELGLNGKVALITGGSEGIGKATASSMASEGAHVIICARRSDVLDQAAKDIKLVSGCEIRTIQADVSQTGQIEELFNKIIEIIRNFFAHFVIFFWTKRKCKKLKF